MDLVNTLQELNALDVGFVSLCEALDLTTPSGRALAGMLAVFAEFERDILRGPREGGNRASKKGRETAWAANDGRQARAPNEAASQRRAQQARNRQAPRRQSHLSYSLATSSEALLAPYRAIFDQWRSDPQMKAGSPALLFFCRFQA